MNYPKKKSAWSFGEKIYPTDASGATYIPTVQKPSGKLNNNNIIINVYLSWFMKNFKVKMSYDDDDDDLIVSTLTNKRKPEWNFLFFSLVFFILRWENHMFVCLS